MGTFSETFDAVPITSSAVDITSGLTTAGEYWAQVRGDDVLVAVRASAPADTADYLLQSRGAFIFFTVAAGSTPVWVRRASGAATVVPIRVG